MKQKKVERSQASVRQDRVAGDSWSEMCRNINSQMWHTINWRLSSHSFSKGFLDHLLCSQKLKRNKEKLRKEKRREASLSLNLGVDKALPIFLLKRPVLVESGRLHYNHIFILQLQYHSLRLIGNFIFYTFSIFFLQGFLDF